jgi:hypothetical protein
MGRTSEGRFKTSRAGLRARRRVPSKQKAAHAGRRPFRRSRGSSPAMLYSSGKAGRPAKQKEGP